MSFFLGGGWAGGVPTNQDTTAVYSSKSAECEYVTMTLSAKMQAQQLCFFWGPTNQQMQAPYYQLQVTGYSLHVYKRPRLPGYLVGAHPKNAELF